MSDSLNLAKDIILSEIGALHTLLRNLNEDFNKAVALISSTKGRVVVTGVGKSGLIGRKISATLSSVGIPSHFISPLDALHGDLGSVVTDDIILMVSNSGMTRELLELLPSIQRRGIDIIALVGKIDSPLAQSAKISMPVSVEREACPHGVIPTSSTTAALVMGDALAICCAQNTGFSIETFRDNHPQGAIGERIKRTLGCKLKIAL